MQRFYDLNRVDCTFGEFVLSEYGEGGAIEIAPVADEMNETLGLGGGVYYDRSNDNRYDVTLTFAANGLAARDMGLALNQQRAAQLANGLGGKQLRIRDQISGDVVTGIAVIKSRPTITKAQSAGDRVWVLSMPSPTVVQAGNVLA